MPSSYVVGPHFEAVIQKLIASGRFSNASEVVRAGLRLLEDFEEERQRRYDEVMEKIEEGIRSAEAGDTVPAEEVFAELEAMMDRESYQDAAE